MPLRLGTSGSVRASSTPKSARWAHVVHTFWPVSTHSSPSRSARVASEARSDPAPGSLNSWHHTSSLRTIGGQEAQPLLLGAVGEQRGRGQVEPERVEPAEVVRAQLGLDRRGPTRRRHVEPAVRDRPGRRRRARTRRTPGTRPRSRPGSAPRGSAAAPPRAAASRHAAGTCRRPTPAPTVGGVGSASSARRWRSRGGRSSSIAHRPRKSGARFSRKAARPSRKSSLRDDSSSANASFCSWCVERRRLRRLCSSHLVSPSATVGPAASCVDERRRPRRRARSAGTARWTAPSSAASVAVERAAEQQQLAGPHRRRRAGAAATWRRCRA